MQFNSKAVKTLTLLVGLVVFSMPLLAVGPAFQSTSLPRLMRVEGVTETAGEIFLQVTNPNAATMILAGSTINIVYSAAVTAIAAASASLTCTVANAIVVCPGAPAPVVTSAGNQLTITFGANYVLANANDGFTIGQVRINASANGLTPVTATLSGVSTDPVNNPITFTNPVLNVGTPQTSITVTGPTAATQGAYLTCTVATNTFVITVKENFPAALTNAAQEAAFTPGIVTTNGSTLDFIFTGIPTGYAITAAPVGTIGGVNATNAPTPAIPAGGYVPATTGAAISLNYAIANAAAVGPPVVLAGSALSVADTFTFSFTIANAATVAAGGLNGTITGRARLAPVSTTAATIARFVDNNTATFPVGSVSDCVTNLLFPYVSNQASFDTSIAIANTTADDLAFAPAAGAAAQAGTCTLTLYPTTDLTTGAAGAASQITTPSVASGGTYAFSMSGTSFAGASGYLLGVCRFLNAHAFAFIQNGFGGAPSVSHGYLALILPSPPVRVIAGGEGLNN